ncbi:MAG TPA: DUF169 domain-containing protein [Clostridia bacterium]|jgi:uncharacterized protein (DUF169 family)|nr:DUF169 domain-containing protein [Clostridia bacterium]
MAIPEKNQKLNDVVNQYLRPATFPVAVKIYKKGEEVPFKARVPMRDLKHRLAICQGMTIARKYGWTLAFNQEDQACPLAQVILGYTDEPDFIKDGSVVFPLYAETMEAAAKTQASTPKMPQADTGTIVLAPLHKAEFDPDVVVIYGNPAQVVRMIQGGLYKEGGYIESRFAGRGACGGEITVPYTQNKYNVIIPGGGEKVFALTGDDEMAFAMPASKIDDFMKGLVATHDGGVARIPTPVYGVNVQPAFPKYYWELEKYCGLRD